MLNGYNTDFWECLPGAPIRSGPLPVGPKAPYLKNWGKIGDARERDKENKFLWRSPFMGSPIRCVVYVCWGLWGSEDIDMRAHIYMQCLASLYVYVEYVWSTRRVCMCWGCGGQKISVCTHTHMCNVLQVHMCMWNTHGVHVEYPCVCVLELWGEGQKISICAHTHMFNVSQGHIIYSLYYMCM